MAILIDPPLWPAHGTTFAHLVSDDSLDELHAFAARAGLPEHAFDGDHYDVPARRHDELVALGAQAVSGRELIQRLRTSGLRIPARDRAESLRRSLRTAWEHLATGIGLPEPHRTEVGADLINRWAEPHRRYHDLRHLRDVLAALDVLCEPGEPPVEVALAAWFHDAVYAGVPDKDEQASADLARTMLTGAGLRTASDSSDPPGPHRTDRETQPILPADVVEEVARLVLLTRTHAPEPGDHHGALLCDADLAVLGRDGPGYRRYTRDVRAEYAHVREADFSKGRAAVVGHLLTLEPLYRTARGQDLWQERARANLRTELAALIAR